MRATFFAHLILLGLMALILSEAWKLCNSSLCSLLQPPATSSVLGPNILLSTLFSNVLSIYERRVPSWFHGQLKQVLSPEENARWCPSHDNLFQSPLIDLIRNKPLYRLSTLNVAFVLYFFLHILIPSCPYAFSSSYVQTNEWLSWNLEWRSCH